MFSFIKRIRNNKDNISKKDYNLSYDNLAIPEIHIKESGEEASNSMENTNQEQTVKELGAQKPEALKDKQPQKSREHVKTQVTYDGVAVPEIHFKNED